MFRWLKQLFGSDGSTHLPPAPTSRSTVSGEMNEGDIHSGPFGYSPNTPYQETQYGSRFDEEAEWNEEHG